MHLPNSTEIQRFIRFGLVGGSGVGVNAGILWILTDFANLDPKIGSLIAIEISILTNFMLNDYWTWGDRHSKPFISRIFQYHTAVAFSALVVNWGLLVLLTTQFQFHYQLANLIGIATGMFLNFVVNHFWTYSKEKSH